MVDRCVIIVVNNMYVSRLCVLCSVVYSVGLCGMIVGRWILDYIMIG